MKIITTFTIKKEAEYPKIMKSKEGDLIVLFSHYGGGTVLKDKPCNKVGEHSNGWAMECFEEFNGVVTLTQK